MGMYLEELKYELIHPAIEAAIHNMKEWANTLDENPVYFIGHGEFNISYFMSKN